MSKAKKILTLLSEGKTIKEVAKATKSSEAYVYYVRWTDKKGKAAPKKKKSKIVKAAKEMKQALTAVDDTGKTILNEAGKIKEGTRIGGLTLRKLPGDMWTWKKETKAYLVNHLPHYKSGVIETIDFIETQDLNYRLGNVVKYVARAGRKATDPIEDLKKAAWYLQREISARENA